MIHCSVCSDAFNHNCLFPDVPGNVFEHFANMLGIQWLCPEDRNLSVSRLLDHGKLMERPSPFDEIVSVSDITTKPKKAQPPTIPATASDERRTLRFKRKNTAAAEVIPKKRVKKASSKRQPALLLQQIDVVSPAVPALSAVVVPLSCTASCCHCTTYGSSSASCRGRFACTASCCHCTTF